MKRLIVVLLWLWAMPSAWAQHSLWLTQSGTGLSASAVNYFSVMADSGPNATELSVQTIAPVAGTITRLRVVLDDAPANGGGTQTYTFAVMVAGSASTVTCAISEAATSCTDLTNLVAVTVGQLIDIRCTPSGTPTSRGATTSLDFDSETGGGADPSTALLGGSGGTTLSSIATNYIPLHAHDLPTTTEFDIQTLLPSAGTIKRLYINLSADPSLGAGVQSYAFTVNVGGVASAITCTVSEGSTTCNSGTTEVAVSAGQLLSLACVPTLAPTASAVNLGIVFVPAQRGTFVLALSTADTLNGAATEYNKLSSSGASFNATETLKDDVTDGFTVQTLYVNLSVAPQNGAGTQSYTFQFRDDVANAGPACAISEDATTCNNSTNGVVAAGSLCDTRVTPASTPVSTPKAQISYLGLIAPRKCFLIE